MPQPIAVSVIRHIEEYWGEELSRDLAKRVVRESTGRLTTFYEAWPESDEAFTGADAPEPLKPGQIRPVFGSRFEPALDHQMSLQLLLLTPSVLVDCWSIEPMWLYLEDARAEDNLVASLSWLADAKPLILDGSIQFTAKARGEHPSQSSSISTTLAATKKKHWKGTPYATLSKKQRRASDDFSLLGVASNFVAATRGEGTATALSSVERRAYELLLKRRTLDGRQARVETLASLDLPLIQEAPELLVKLRTEEESYATFRGALDSALGNVAALPEGYDSEQQARDIVRDSLESSLSSVRSELNGSGFLGKAKRIGKSLVVGGIAGALGAGVSFMADPSASPIPGLLGGAASGAPDVVDEYLALKKAEQANKAIWDIVGAFE